MKLLLNPGLDRHRNVPKEYDLTITNMRATNIFAFSEKDLPGYKPPAFGRPRPDAGGGGTGGGYRVQKGQKGWPRYRKSIPSALASLSPPLLLLCSGTWGSS